MKKIKIILNGWIFTYKNIIGLLFFLALFGSGFLMNGNTALFFNLSGLLIVIGGTFGATLISFRMNKLIMVFKVLFGSYKHKLTKESEIIEILVDLSVKRRLKGLLSLQEDSEETAMLFLRRALGYLVDGYSVEQIKDLVGTEIYFFKARREKAESIFRTMAEICPSFGIVGSVVGLIAMLSGVGDTTMILKTVPIALTSTLYGVVFANFFFLPFAANIRERTNHEILLAKIILDGVIAIGSEHHPRMLEQKLKSFLTPSSREGNLVSLERIRKKFMIADKQSAA